MKVLAQMPVGGIDLLFTDVVLDPGVQLIAKPFVQSELALRIRAVLDAGDSAVRRAH